MQQLYWGKKKRLKKTKNNPWTLKVPLRPSSVLLVGGGCWCWCGLSQRCLCQRLVVINVATAKMKTERREDEIQYEIMAKSRITTEKWQQTATTRTTTIPRHLHSDRRLYQHPSLSQHVCVCSCSCTSRPLVDVKMPLQLSHVFKVFWKYVTGLYVEIHTCCRQWHDSAQCTYEHSCLQSLSPDQVWGPSIVSVLIIRHWRALRMNVSRKTIHGSWHIVILFHHVCVVIGGARELDSFCVVVDSSPVEVSCGVVFSVVVVAGPLLLVGPVCGETQEEQSSKVSREILSDLECRWRWSKLSYSYNRNSTRWELKLAAESGVADAVRAINNLATAQVRRDTPSLIDVKGLGRPKEFSGREGGFSTVVEEDGGFLCRWDQGVWVDVGVGSWTNGWNHDDSYRSRVPAEWNECGQRSVKPEVCVAADAHSTHGSHELWGKWHGRQLAGESVGGMAETAEAIWSDDRRKKTKLFVHDHFSWRCSLQELQAGIKRWESYVSRNEKKLKDKLDD